MPNPAPLRANCTTSIFCASTAATPTTDRPRRDECRPALVQFFDSRPPVTRRPCHHRFLFCSGAGDWFVPEGASEYRRRFFHGGPRDDGVGCGPGVSVGKSWVARTHGLGGQFVQIWDPRSALVLDWGHPRH